MFKWMPFRIEEFNKLREQMDGNQEHSNLWTQNILQYMYSTTLDVHTLTSNESFENLNTNKSGQNLVVNKNKSNNFQTTFSTLQKCYVKNCHKVAVECLVEVSKC